MSYTLSELERAAYMRGDPSQANFLGHLIDAKRERDELRAAAAALLLAASEHISRPAEV